ncbi:MAG: MAPEG family protein [candidate division SR1 bacterium]|nr:MAPEG family protein [candidate division SR1 bacterium]
MSIQFYTVIFITILITLLTQASQVSIIRTRRKFDIPPAGSKDHAELDRFHRAHTDQIEQNIVFLPILWVSSVLVNWMFILLLGLSWVLLRAVYIRGFVTKNDKIRDLGSTGYLAVQITLFFLVFAGFGIDLLDIKF